MCDHIWQLAYTGSQNSDDSTQMCSTALALRVCRFLLRPNVRPKKDVAKLPRQPLSQGCRAGRWQEASARASSSAAPGRTVSDGSTCTHPTLVPASRPHALAAQRQCPAACPCTPVGCGCTWTHCLQAPSTRPVCGLTHPVQGSSRSLAAPRAWGRLATPQWVTRYPAAPTRWGRRRPAPLLRRDRVGHHCAAGPANPHSRRRYLPAALVSCRLTDAAPLHRLPPNRRLRAPTFLRSA